MCGKKKWLARNPLEEVEGVGKRKHGKSQLRVDEARRWLVKAMALADEGEAGAVAALLALVMGMRANEIVSRVVRDLDDDGKLLWIPDSKTEAGRRTLQVPELLRPFLKELAEGKSPEAKLFGHHWRDWVRKWVKRICEAAGVPMVTAHGMRGLHSTLAVENGVSAHVVAASLGHESERHDDPELREARGGRRSAAASGDDRAGGWPTRLLSLKRLDRESFQTDLPEEKMKCFVEMNGIEPSAS